MYGNNLFNRHLLLTKNLNCVWCFRQSKQLLDGRRVAMRFDVDWCWRLRNVFCDTTLQVFYRSTDLISIGRSASNIVCLVARNKFSCWLTGLRFIYTMKCEVMCACYLLLGFVKNIINLLTSFTRRLLSKPCTPIICRSILYSMNTEYIAWN